MQPTLLPVLRRAASPGDNLTVLEGVIALVAGRPPRTWTDIDAERFPAQARVIGNLFQQAKEGAIPFEAAAMTEADTRRRDLIVHHLKATISPKTPPHILRAALIALLQELETPPEAA